MKNREEEILKWLDLDELDLQTERLKMFMKPMSETSNKQSTRRKKKVAPVPALDFTKIYEWRDQQNDEEEEEGE